jgi:hypothetical protein
MKSIIIHLLLIGLIVICSCSKDDSEDICKSGQVVHSLSELTEGSFHYDQGLGIYFIRYSVPNKKDSFYIGYLCPSIITEFEFSEGMSVEFSGKFREKPEGFIPSNLEIGETALFLNVTSIISASN